MGGLLQPVVEPACHGVARPGRHVHDQLVVEAQHDPGAIVDGAGGGPARPPPSVLKNSAAAPCTIALRPYRPRAAARERPSGSDASTLFPPIRTSRPPRVRRSLPPSAGTCGVGQVGHGDRVVRSPDRAAPRRPARWSGRTSRRARPPWRCRGRRPAGPPPARTCRCPASPRRARRRPTRRRGSAARSGRGRRGRTRDPARRRSPAADRRACCAGRRSPSSARRRRPTPTTRPRRRPSAPTLRVEPARTRTWSTIRSALRHVSRSSTNGWSSRSSSSRHALVSDTSMPTRRSSAFTLAGLRRSSRCSTGMWRSTRSSRSAASVTASPAFDRPRPDEPGDQRFGDGDVDRQSVVFEFGAQRLGGRLRVDRASERRGRGRGSSTAQHRLLLAPRSTRRPAGAWRATRSGVACHPRTGRPLGAQVARTDRAARPRRPPSAVVGEQIRRPGGARARTRCRGREPSPRSPPASCASLRRACDGPRRDPTSAPDGRPRATSVPRRALRPPHPAWPRRRARCGRIVPATAGQSIHIGGSVGESGSSTVDDRRADALGHRRRASRSGHPQPSSSSRSSSIPAACATSWITVTNTSSANCSRSSHASHSASR